MQLKVHARYRTQAVSYEAGQIIDASEAEAAHLMADSPGTFSALGVTPSPAVEDVPDLDAMSTEMATGFAAPDRKMRRGSKR